MTPIWIALTLAGTPAWANDEDDAACEGLKEGDACIDHNGRDGTCIPDESDPDVLTCESNEDLPGDTGTDDTGTDDTGTDDTGTDDTGTDDTGTDDTGTDRGGSGGGDFDKAACEGLEEGDACIDHNDREGTCVPDESDPNVLTCESNEDLQRLTGESTSCSTGGSAPTWLWLGALAGVGRIRRRR